MSRLPITLNSIWRKRPPSQVWPALMTYLGKQTPDDEPVLVATIIAAIGLDAALVCIRQQGPVYLRAWERTTEALRKAQQSQLPGRYDAERLRQIEVLSALDKQEHED